jgi:hypothetical protein
MLQKRTKGRKIRRDASTPRMNDRDIHAFHWIGEQGAASIENLQELLGRPHMRELLGSQAGETTKEAEKLSATRVRHIIEERWAQAGMVNCEMILGRKCVWLSQRALHMAGLPFSPHRPALSQLDHLHHVNRIRLYLERLSNSANLSSHWESACWFERKQQEWRVRQKAEPDISIPDVYCMRHTPAGIWTFRDEGTTVDSSVIIEVSANRSWNFDLVLRELYACKGVVWFFVEMDPKQAVFSGLKRIFEKLNDQDKSRFYFYDLAEPGRLVYHFE